MKVRPIMEPLEAHRWFQNGDHPDDDSRPMPRTLDGTLTEGKVVRYYRHPDRLGTNMHKVCGSRWHEHGWIDQGDTGVTICPGDWILKGLTGHYFKVRPAVFELSYEPVEDQ